MIGFYNYTVILTYLSLVSAGIGIVTSLSGTGHPYIGMIFLLFCGLCDAFDGKVARTKKDRCDTECKFGIQIDSLSDVVAFGVLPVCIGAALYRQTRIMHVTDTLVNKFLGILLLAIMAFYILAAMIRLAYFNVTEEERQKTEGGTRKYYLGLPVTSAAIIFPTILLICYIFRSTLKIDLSPIYFGVLILTAFLFLLKFQLKKPGLKTILIMVAVGVLEFALLLTFYLLFPTKL